MRIMAVLPAFVLMDLGRRYRGSLDAYRTQGMIAGQSAE